MRSGSFGCGTVARVCGKPVGKTRFPINLPRKPGCIGQLTCLYGLAELWPSGRRRAPAKGVNGEPFRGFESLRLRQHDRQPPSYVRRVMMSSHELSAVRGDIFMVFSFRDLQG